MRIEFLNPAAWWALPIIVIPFLLYFFFNRPQQEILFSDLYILKKLERRLSPTRKKDNFWILLLRTLALLCLLLFFVRPILYRSDASSGSGTVSLAVLWDDSASMNYTENGIPLYTQMKETLKRALSVLDKRDNITWIRFSDGVEEIREWSNPGDKITSALTDVTPKVPATRLDRAIEQALEILDKKPDSQKAILVLSDLARSSVKKNDSLSPQARKITSNVRFFYPDPNPEKSNLAVMEVELQPDFYSEILQVEAKIKNFSLTQKLASEVILWQVDAEGKEAQASRTQISLAPEEEQIARLSLPLYTQAKAGFVSLDSDALLMDNRRYFTLHTLKRIRVLCIEEETALTALSGRSYYLKQALETRPKTFDVQTIALSDLRPEILNNYDVVCICDAVVTDGDFLRALKNFHQQGKGILIALGPRSQTFHQASFFAPEFHALGASSAQDKKILIQPLSSTLEDFFSQFELDKIQVSKIVDIDLSSDYYPWITLNDGRPLLALSSDDRVALLLTTIDRTWNNLPTKAIYVSLMRELIKTLAEKNDVEANVSTLTIGQRWQRTQSVSKRVPRQLLAPSGQPVLLEPNGNGWQSAPLEEPGLYQLTQETASGTEISWIAVNIDTKREESDVVPLGHPEKNFPDTKWIALPNNEKFSSAFSQQLRGTDSSRIFLLLAALLFLCEWFLTQWIKKRGF